MFVILGEKLTTFRKRFRNLPVAMNICLVYVNRFEIQKYAADNLSDDWSIIGAILIDFFFPKINWLVLKSETNRIITGS